jgi:hypothetical protein
MRALGADKRPSRYHPRVPASYDDAILELYRAPHSAFVTERKRLAGELKAAGDKAGAAKLAKLTRPPVSAWAVNQLWWQDRKEVEALLATAERLRAGDLGAAAAHRETLGKLRARAAAILAEAGHGASEATLRRVAMTLSAVAAGGGFDPDPPGALPDDRDPPGFETMGFAAAAVAAAPAAERGAAAEADEDEEFIVAADADEAADDKAADDEAEPAHDIAAAAARRRQRQAADDDHRRAAEAAARKRPAEEDARHRAALEAQQRAEAAAEQWRREEQAARRRAVRERVEAALRTAQGEVERQERDLEKLRASITAAEERLERARAIATDLEAKLADLD